MKRPIGVTLSALWMGFILSAVTVLAVRADDVRQLIALIVGLTAFGPVVIGLWCGRAWAAKSFRLLLGLACIVATVAGIVSLSGSSMWHGPFYYFGRSIIMGLWCGYFLTRPVRRFFGETAMSSTLDEPTLYGGQSDVLD